MEKPIKDRKIDRGGTHPHLLSWLIPLLVALVMLACIVQNPGASTTTVPQGSTGEATMAMGGATTATAGATTATGGATQTPAAEADPLDRLLAMHSIQFNQTALKPDGTSNSVQGEIDSAGNMHLTFHSEASLPAGVLGNSGPTQMKQDYEWYVVDGKAYEPDDQNPAWMTTPLDEDYGQELSDLLHGQDGPGLWLDILPDGSLHSAGQETVGGFATNKYSVNGVVNNQTITGSLWYESQGHALVKVALTIPAALLLSINTQPAQGELKITLEAQKADVPLVKLPAAPAGTSGATPPAGATPSSEAMASPAAGGAGAPSVANVYSLAHVAFFSSMAISPGKVWVGSLLGTVDAYDAQTGAPLQSISLFPDSGGMTALPVQDLLYDGQNLWALAISNTELVADRLFVISPADGKILQQFDTSQWQNHDDARLGFSPGLVWTESHVIDTKTFEAKHVAHPDSPIYRYDGSGWMWIMGTFCQECGYDIWLFNTANLPEEKYGPKAVENTTAMTTVGDRMWVATEKTSGNITTHVLQVYAADGEKTSGDTQPLQTLAPVDDHPLSLLYDGHALWLLAGGKNQGALFQLDPQSGATVNRLDIPASMEGDVPADIAFDGHNLWVLTVKQLVRISLPWG